MTIHFRDNYGYGAIDVERNEVSEVMQNLRNDPTVEDIWFDEYDEEDC